MYSTKNISSAIKIYYIINNWNFVVSFTIKQVQLYFNVTEISLMLCYCNYRNRIQKLKIEVRTKG